MAQTLLQKARAMNPKMREINIPPEQLELVVAWVKDEITLSQVIKVTRSGSTNVYAMFARGVKQLYRDGLIKIKESV